MHMGKRPAGISILSFIYILITVIGLLTNRLSMNDDWFSYVILIILGVSAVALYMGQRWAWWVIGSMTVFSIMVNITNLYFSLSNLDLIPDVNKFYFKFGAKLLIQSLILALFLSKPVIQFFAFKNLNTLQRLLILSGTAGLMYLVLHLISLVK